MSAQRGGTVNFYATKTLNAGTKCYGNFNLERAT